PLPYHLATAPRDVSSQPTRTFSTHPGPGWNRRSISRKGYREEPARRRRFQRLREERTLPKLASEPNETLPLCDGVDTLGDHTQVKRPGQVDHRAHNLQIRAAPPHTVNEHVVDLDALDGQARQLAEGGLSGSEFVHVQLVAQA